MRIETIMHRLYGFGSLRLLPLAAALALLGCEDTGQARISWSIAGQPVQSAYDCSRHGLARVVVTFEDARGNAKASFTRSCSRGETGAREVPTGTYQVRVQAYGPTGLPFEDPSTGETSVVTYLTDLHVGASGVAEATADLTPNPPCADFVDNDGDGIVDASDPGCYDKTGQYDPDPARGEEDNLGPGLLSVTWQINGGRDTCDEVRPDGAATASLLVDGLETSRFPCQNGSGSVTLAPGAYEVRVALLGPGETVLATTAALDASIVQDLTAQLDFDVQPADFDPPQTGTLRFTLSWGIDGASCGDASPMVAEQGVTLLDAAHDPVVATTLAGVTADGAFGDCVDASTTQGVEEELPVGDYWVSLAGRASTGGLCWSAADLPVHVDIGPNPAVDLLVPVTDASGLCAP